MVSKMEQAERYVSTGFKKLRIVTVDTEASQTIISYSNFKIAKHYSYAKKKRKM